MVKLTHGGFLARLWDNVNKNELMALGGQVTYYLILSFFPFLIVLMTFAGFFAFNTLEILQSLHYLLPESTYAMTERIIVEILDSRSLTLLSFGMLGALWASLNGINAMIRGIVKAYGLKETRSFWGLHLTALVFLVIIALAVFLSLSTVVLGEWLGSRFYDLFGANGLFIYLWSQFRLVIQFLILILIFMILNHMATSLRYSLVTHIPGSLFAAAGWVLISLSFSYYVQHINNYTVVYGSIGGVIVLLLWLNWSSNIFLLGSAINAVLISRHEQKKPLPPDIS